MSEKPTIIDYTNNVNEANEKLLEISQKLKDYDNILSGISSKLATSNGAAKDGLEKIVNEQKTRINNCLSLIATVKSGAMNVASQIKNDSLAKLKEWEKSNLENK